MKCVKKSDKRKRTRSKNRRDAHSVSERAGKTTFRPYDGEPAEEVRSNAGEHEEELNLLLAVTLADMLVHSNVNSGGYS